LIFHLNKLIHTSNKYICITRPRRFGKTVAVNMITKYYQYLENQTTIFNDKKISKYVNWDKYLNKFNIIKLTMNNYFEDRSIEEGIKELKRKIIREVKNSIKQIELKENYFFTDLFQQIYGYTGLQIIFVIDEWDYIIRSKKEETNSHKIYLEFLNTLLKDKDYVALAYITGILPVKKSENQTSLNYFDELSMISPGWTSEYIGFTNVEVEALCTKQKTIIHHERKQKQKQKEIENDYIKSLNNNINKRQILNGSTNNSSKKLKINTNGIRNKDVDIINNKLIYEVKEIKDKKNKKDKKDEKNEKNENIENKGKDEFEVNFENLKLWYNGFKLKNDYFNEYYKIYSPYSIVNALKHNKINNYWCLSETFHSVLKLIDLNFFGLKEDIILLRDGVKIKINISSYQNDMRTFIYKDDIFTMLVHLGYLAYDTDTKLVYIPNKEIQNVFKTITF